MTAVSLKEILPDALEKGYAIPGFLFAIFLIVIFAGGSYLDIFPLRGLISDNWEKYKPNYLLIEILREEHLEDNCSSIKKFLNYFSKYF